MPTNESFKFPEFQRRFSDLRGDKTQAEFADFLGLSRPTVGLYESGKRVPDALTLKRIAEKCEVSADYLLGLSGVESPDLSIRGICNLTGLSSSTVSSLISVKSKIGNDRSSFTCAFADRLLSNRSMEMLEIESEVVRAACIQFFEQSESFNGVLSFTPDQLSELYLDKAADTVRAIALEALEECVGYLKEELALEKSEYLENGKRPDGDFQEIASHRLISESDERETDNG